MSRLSPPLRNVSLGETSTATTTPLSRGLLLMLGAPILRNGQLGAKWILSANLGLLLRTMAMSLTLPSQTYHRHTPVLSLSYRADPITVRKSQPSQGWGVSPWSSSATESLKRTCPNSQVWSK